jgi:hypothetical protein
MNSLHVDTANSYTATIIIVPEKTISTKQQNSGVNPRIITYRD